jgi:cytidine diphosphoramidate kinase
MNIIWITGLSGAGKSTIGNKVVEGLRKNGEQVVYLDGDELREVFGASCVNINNHGRERRLALAMQYSRLCRVIAEQGLTVVIATISMFKEIHSWNRSNLPGYFEVYLKVPVDELRRRDPKQIYKKFDSGELRSVAGLDLEIDEPLDADLIVNFREQATVNELADKIIFKVNERNL